MENTKINICLACDDNYARYAAVVIASILKNAKTNDKLCIYILDGGIEEQNKEKILSLKNIKDCEINFVKIDNEMFSEYSAIKTHSYLSVAAYYRLKLPTILPNVEKIIYFDCDVVVNTSLRELFNTKMRDCVVAGVRDIDKRKVKKNKNYVNSGMLIFDIKKMAEMGVEKQFVDWTREHFETIKLGDQEIINEVLKGKIKVVEDEWNVQSSNFVNRSSYTNTPKIIHFVSKNKPWHFGSFSYHKDYYFKYLQLTPWALQTEEEKKYWIKKNKICSFFGYLRYRPLFFLRPRFYEAVFCTYIKPLFDYKKPIIQNNTFIVWEPCSKSHSEVVPGFCKYLLDLGYHVSVIVHPNRIKEGLFSRFKDENLSINKMSKHQVLKYFQKDNLEDIKGVIVTTVGKLCDSIHYDECFNTFNPNIDKSKIFFVEHEIVHSADAGTWQDDIITLRQMNYKNTKSVVVNPHYFGNINITRKNDTTNFVVVGAIQAQKKDNGLIVDSVKLLHERGVRNFKITVIGKGKLNHLPKEIRQYFDIKGRLPFDKMYNELEKADFMLTAYDESNPMHIRYNTTGTSGNFQLIYGFLKPCLIIRSFGAINGFDDTNSILYNSNDAYADAMMQGIEMSAEDYSKMQDRLKKYVDALYDSSKQNLKELIESRSK